MKPLTVREASKKDMPAFIRLWREINGTVHKGKAGLAAICAETEMLAGIFIRHISAPAEFLALAEVGGKAVGYCLGGSFDGKVHEPGRTGEIRKLAVASEYAENGISGALCSYGRDWFRARGVREICLNPRPEPEEASPFQAYAPSEKRELAGAGCGAGELYKTCWQAFP